ncbi:MAG: excinuclease ABC subunit UvrA [Bacillota bacterium]
MKNSKVEWKEYQLFSIGRLKTTANHAYACIASDFRPALKYLDLFSHVVIFYMADNYQNDDSITWTYKIRRSLCKSIIQTTTAKIINVDEREGIIELDCVDLQKDTVIFDIKPYFPCEDRVRDFTTPDAISSWPEWRVDAKSGKRIDGRDIFRLCDGEEKNTYAISAIGEIRNTQGEYTLQIDIPEADIIDVLKGFSHIKVLWWFSRFDKSTYRKLTQGNPPYENAPRTGIFATRSPIRPNPIAMTTAKILEIDTQNMRLKVSGLDAFDKTPIIDILPYIPVLDRVRECAVPEWLRHWPEWLDDRGASCNADVIEIIKNDSRIDLYFAPQETNEGNSYADVFEDNQSEEVYTEDIVVKGARQNNLKNINITIPKNKMTVITGVSGSGKSSLAFNTIFAESQRRFVDSMSTAGRTVFEQMEKPDVDQISGLPPAVSIEQKTTIKNPRSTVGTMTDIYDYLRLLFAKTGTRHCPECGRAIEPLNTEEIVYKLTRLKPGTDFSIRPFNSSEVIGEYNIPYDGVERGNTFPNELQDSVKKALALGKGALIVNISEIDELVFQTKEMCYHCSRVFFELTTSSFSFNNPESMCPACKGLGVKLEVDVDLIVANPDKSILDGASLWWGDLRKHRKKPNANWMRGEVLALAEEMGVDLELPWRELSEDFRKQVIYGSKGKKVKFTYENSNGRKGEIEREVEGAFNIITRLFSENNGDTANRLAMSFMREKPCSRCKGERLSEEGRMVTLGNTRFPETVAMTIEDLMQWIKALPAKLSRDKLDISLPILKELYRRLQGIIDVGLPYLTLDRSAPTLSGGEAQRLRLATQLSSGITNILYVLDEPSIGLHPRDHNKLIKIIKHIRDAGNTVLIVEHDADTILAADKIIDIGPGAGEHGGLVIAEGTPEEIIEDTNSITGKYLSNLRNVSGVLNRARKRPNGWIKLTGARHNNLKNINIDIPIGVLTCFTGVSGSGKSSLVAKTLYPALSRLLNKSEDMPGEYDSISGADKLDKIISVSQQPIGRTPRSNPATYTGVFDDIRNLYAATSEAKSRGYKQNKFSFNSKEGQCESCGGEGRKCVQMHFMPDIWIECSACHGKRFNKEALEIKYKDKTIADVLEMNVEEALEFFAEHKKIQKVLQTLFDVGLGYIKLGQSALTLSGGEAQRIKLAKELSISDTGNTIYLLDEPTTGLHFSDIENLLSILHRITDSGNTVLIIEHNLDIIRNADWVIDLGPEGGRGGGQIVALGTPEVIAECEDSYTGKVLRSMRYKPL